MSKNSSAAPAPGKGPAQTEAAGQNFLLEIEESVRRDELVKWWKEYGPYLLAGIVIAILITGVTSAYRAWDNKTGAAQTATLLAALDSPDVAAALDGVAGDMKPGLRAVALLSQAAALVQDGREADAASVFEKAAGQRDLPALYRDLALLQGVRLRAGQDGADDAALLARLAPLLKDDGNPWHVQACLTAASIAADGLGDVALARRHLATALAAQNVPEALAEKARMLDHVYALRAPAGGPETVSAAPPKNAAPKKEKQP